MKNKLEENKFYKIKMNIFGRCEEYEGKVKSLNNTEFRLETDNDNQCRALTLRQKDIIYAKEIHPQKKEKTHKISNKKKFKNLKQPDLPKF